MDDITKGRLLDSARRYADAEPSDPFILARAAVHLRVGIVGPVWPMVGNNRPYALYDAKVRDIVVPYTSVDGSEKQYIRKVYSDRVRP